MKISISQVQAKGLRCPDIDIDLYDQSSGKAVNLIQMPNGTGKTTIISLIKAILSRSVESWKPSDIREYKNKESTSDSGEFKLKLIIQKSDEDEEINASIALKFDFVNSAVEQLYFNKDGLTNVWPFPTELIPYFQEDCVNLFVFMGDKADQLLTQDTGDALTPVKTFFGLTSIEDLNNSIEDLYKRKVSTRGNQTFNSSESNLRQKLELWMNREKSLVSTYKDIKNTEKEKRKELENLKEEHKKLFEAAGLQTQVAGLEKDIQKNTTDISNKNLKIMDVMRDPFSFSDSIQSDIKILKNTLDDLDLPGTSRSFFDRWLPISETCFCGEHLTDSKKEIFKKNIESFLTDDDINVIENIKNEAESVFEISPSSELETLFEELSGLINEKKSLELQKRRLENELTEISGSNSEEILKRRDDLVKELNTLDLKMGIIESKKPIRTYKPFDEPKACKSVSDCKEIVLHLSDELSALSGKKVYADSKKVLSKIITKTLTNSLKELQNSLVKSTNEKLESFLGDREKIEVLSINKNLQLGQNNQEQAQGSGAQNAIAIYSFATSILERAEANFPLIVDHPVTALDNLSREKLGEKITEITHQFIGFLIDTERQVFLDSLERSADINYVTIFRNWPGNINLYEALTDEEKQKCSDSTNACLSYRKDFFHHSDMGTADV